MKEKDSGETGGWEPPCWRAPPRLCWEHAHASAPASAVRTSRKQFRTERRPVRFCQSIAPVRLFLDDIEQIVAYLLELSPARCRMLSI